MKKTRLLAGLMALCMLFCMLPVVALATGNAVTIDGTVIADGTTVNGATLNGSTLTLNGVSAETIKIPATVTTIVLQGANTLTYASAESAILAAGDLTVKGTGSLTVNGGYGIAISAEGTVTVDAVKVTIDGAAVGIYSNKTGAVAAQTLPTPTLLIDFTTPGVADNGYGLAAYNNVVVDTDYSKGYLDIVCSGDDPWVHFSTHPQDNGVAGNQMGYFVVKYANKASLTDQATIMYNGGSNGNGWGGQQAAWRWPTKDGSWDVVTVWDGKDITADGETVTSVVPWATDSATNIRDFRLDFWSFNLSGGLTGAGLKLAYIAFFATQADAEAYAAAEKQVLEVEAATGITADKVYTQGGASYTADTVIPLSEGASKTALSGAPTGTFGVQVCCDNVLLDGAAQCTSNANTWLTNNNTINMDTNSKMAVYGWINTDKITSVTHVGYQIGGTTTWIACDTSTTNAHSNGTYDANDPIFYDAELAGFLGTSARRFYIEIPASAVPSGITQACFVIKTASNTFRFDNWPTFYLQKNVAAYTGNGVGYGVVGTDLTVGGVDCGLNLVTDGSNNWAVGGASIPVTPNGSTYSHDAYVTSGYNVGVAYTVNVKDVSGLPVEGATVKMYNTQGNVIARVTTKGGVAILYATVAANYTFSVEGNFTTQSGLTATNNVVNATTDFDSSNVVAITVQNGAFVTVINAELPIITNDGTQKVIVDSAILNVDESSCSADFSANKVAISGASVTVGENFAVNVYLTAAIGGTKLVSNGVEYPVYIKDGRVVATVDGIAPQAIVDDLSLSLVDAYGNNQYTLSRAYSVKTNFFNLYKKETSSDTLKTLVASLLNYAAAAQTYTGYKTENLANSNGLEGSNLSPDASVNVFNMTGTDVAGYSFGSASVYYDNTNKLYATVIAADMSKVTVKINGTNAALVADANGNYGVYTDAIAANNFGTTYTFELYANGVLAQTLTYSVNTYAYRMGDAGNANAALALALYNYGVAAGNYVA